MDFGMKLQDLRKQRGLSQEGLAEKVGVSRQAVSKWETGEGYPEMDKLILLSDMFDVSLDYLIKDTGQSIQQNDNDEEENYFMSTQKIQEYFEGKKKFGFRLSISVAMIIMSLLCPVWTSDTKYENIGIFGMLTIVAIAVGIIIVSAMATEKNSELEEKRITMSFQDSQSLQEEYTHFRTKFGMSIAFGVVLIILSVAAIILIGEGELEDRLGPTLLFICVAIAVFTFINVGMKDNAYHFLVQNKKYIAEKKAAEQSLFAITMPLAAMVYLVLGFTTGLWHPGWIIFPVASIITMAIDSQRKKCNDE